MKYENAQFYEKSSLNKYSAVNKSNYGKFFIEELYVKIQKLTNDKLCNSFKTKFVYLL